MYIAFIVFIIVAFPSTTVAVTNIPIKLDNQPLDVTIEIVAGRILVPLIAITEVMEISATNQTEEITITNKETKITLTVNKKEAMINGKKVFLEVPANTLNNEMYIPLRFVIEALGGKVRWSPHTVHICYTNCQSSMNISIPTRKVNIGTPFAEVKNQLGHYQDRLSSQYSFDWFIFHNQFIDYYQVGVEGGEVVAIYSTSEHFSVQSLSIHSTKDEVRKTLGILPITSLLKGSRNYIYSSKEWDLFLVNDHYVTFFYDLHNGTSVSAIQVVKKEYEFSLQGYYGVSDERLRGSYEKQMFYLVNVIRVKEGLPIIVWNPLAAQIARAHSFDMASNDYFDHYNLHGESPFERMKKNGLDYRYAGENLAVGQFSAIFAHHSLLNSYGHRKNMIHTNFREIGIGVAFREDRPFFTQKFVTQ